MTLPVSDLLPRDPCHEARLRVARAKASLLDWAEESDRQIAERKPKTMLVVGGGLLALVGGFIFARVFSKRGPEKPAESEQPVGKTLLGLLLAARVARWIVPLAITVVRTFSSGKARARRE